MLKIKDANGELVATLSDDQDEPVLSEDAMNKRNKRKKKKKPNLSVAENNLPIYNNNNDDEKDNK